MDAASNPALYCEAKPVPTQQLVRRSLHETFADVNLFPVCSCREKHNPAETQKDRQLSRSMSDSPCWQQLSQGLLVRIGESSSKWKVPHGKLVNTTALSVLMRRAG